MRTVRTIYNHVLCHPEAERSKAEGSVPSALTTRTIAHAFELDI
jgi:hypothetical protein